MVLKSKTRNDTQDFFVVKLENEELNNVQLFLFINDTESKELTIINNEISFTISKLNLKDTVTIRTKTASNSYIVFSYSELNSTSLVNNIILKNTNNANKIPMICTTEFVNNVTKNYAIENVTINTPKKIEENKKSINLNVAFLDNYNRGFNEGFMIAQTINN